MISHRRSRQGASLALLLLAALALLVSACTGIASPEGGASPVLGDGLLLASHRDRLFALEAEGLKERWAFPPDDGDDVDVVALYGEPALNEDTVFVPTYDGALYAVDRENGAVRWGFDTDGALIGGAVASEEAVYFGSDDGKVYALDPEGEPIWAPFETDDAIWSTPALVGDTLYVTSLDGKLYALDAASGRERWSFATDAGIASPPVVDELAGVVLVGGFDSRLRAIDIRTHQEQWSVAADNWFWTRPLVALVARGVVYAGSLDGKVYAVEVESGAAYWREPFRTGAPVRAAPVIAGGVLIVVDRDGTVYALNADGGGLAGGQEPLALGADVLADPLVVIEGRGLEAREVVVVVTAEGELVRIDPVALRVVDRRELGAD